MMQMSDTNSVALGFVARPSEQSMVQRTLQSEGAQRAGSDLLSNSMH